MSLSDEPTGPANPGSPRLRLLSHFRVLLVSFAGTSVLAFVTAVVAARALGPLEWGYVSVALAAVSYASVLGDGGLTDLAQVRVVRAGGRDGATVWTAAALQTVLAVLAAAAVTALVWLLPFPHRVRLLTLWALPVLLGQAWNTFYALEADERMSVVARLRLLMQCVTTALCLGGLALGLRGTTVPTSQWLGLAVADVLAVSLLKRGGYRRTRPDRDVARALVRQAAPYLLALVATQILLNADIVILGLDRPIREVGQYGVALRLAVAGLALIGVLITAVFPELVRRLAGPAGGASPLILRLVRLSCRPGFAGAAVLLFLAHPLVRLLYGSSYAGSARYLQVVILLVPLGFYNSILAQTLVAAGRQWAYFRVAGGTAALSVIALLIVVPEHGAMAAAWVVVGGELVSLTTLSLAVHGPLGLRPLPVLMRQAPFYLVPVALGLLARRLLDATDWESTALALVAVLACEALAPTHVLGELRGLRRGGERS